MAPAFSLRVALLRSEWLRHLENDRQSSSFDSSAKLLCAMTNPTNSDSAADSGAARKQAPGDSVENDFDAKAVTMIRLMRRLDGAVLALRKIVRPIKPWQRTLLRVLDETDRAMQVLRMMEAMDKSDQMLAEATLVVAKACRQVALAVNGSRADGLVRSSAAAIAKSGKELCRLVLEAVPIDPRCGGEP